MLLQLIKITCGLLEHISYGVSGSEISIIFHSNDLNVIILMHEWWFNRILPTSMPKYQQTSSLLRNDN